MKKFSDILLGLHIHSFWWPLELGIWSHNPQHLRPFELGIRQATTGAWQPPKGDSKTSGPCRPRTASVKVGVATGGSGGGGTIGGVVGRARGAEEAGISGGRGGPKRTKVAGAGAVPSGARESGAVAGIRVRADFEKLLGRCVVLAERVVTAAEDWVAGDTVTRLLGRVCARLHTRYQVMAQMQMKRRPKECEQASRRVQREMPQSDNKCRQC